MRCSAPSEVDGSAERRGEGAGIKAITARRRPTGRRPIVGPAPALLAALLVLAACAPEEPVADPTPEEALDTEIPAETETPADEPTPDEPVEDEPANVELDLADLPAPGDARYTLWVVTAGQAQQTGVLDEPEDGRLTATVALDGLEPDDIQAVLVAVEGAQTADEPLALLGGDVVDGTADLAVEHDAALGAAVEEASGTFLLGSPSDEGAPEQAGIWFLQVTPEGNVPSLELAPPPEGWVYEAWGTRDGVTLSAGRSSTPTTRAPRRRGCKGSTRRWATARQPPSCATASTTPIGRR